MELGEKLSAPAKPWEEFGVPANPYVDHAANACKDMGGAGWACMHCIYEEMDNAGYHGLSRRQKALVMLANQSDQLRDEAHPNTHDRAMGLLKRFLTPKQIRDMHVIGEFTVMASDGVEYTVSTSAVVNIRDRYRRYCVGPAGALPAGDVLLAQVLWLLSDAHSLLSAAN